MGRPKMKIFLIVLLVIHGIIHLLGFLKAYQYLEIAALKQYIGPASGILWLTACVLLLLTALLLVLQNGYWAFFGIATVLLSQLLIILSWSDARYGTLINIVLLLIMIPALGKFYFDKMVVNETKQLLMTIPSDTTGSLEKADLTTLPPIVIKWIRSSGTLDIPEIKLIRLKQKGRLKTSPSGSWMPFTAEQWITTQEPGFIWKTTVQLMGPVFFVGRDKLYRSEASMKIKLLSVFNVVNAQNDKKLDEASLLRFLAESCWYPATALEPYIEWEAISPLQARARLKHNGVSVSGIFTFLPDGRLKSFEAHRYMGSGKEARLEKWFVENTSYKEFNGVIIPNKSKISWKLAAGDFQWLTLEISDITYNDMPSY